MEPVPAHSVQIDVTAVPASFTGPRPVLSCLLARLLHRCCRPSAQRRLSRTMPGLPAQPAQPPQTGPSPHQAQPQPPAVFVEPPTVPVPIVQPQVFYFDDLSSHSEAPDREGHKPRRLGRRRRRSDVTAEHLLPALPPPPASGVSDKAPAAGRGPKGRRKSVVGVVLAAAAICVAVAAIGLTIVGLPGSKYAGRSERSQNRSAIERHPPCHLDFCAIEVADYDGGAEQTRCPCVHPKRHCHVRAELCLRVDRGQRQRTVLARGQGQQPLGRSSRGTLEAGVHFS